MKFTIDEHNHTLDYVSIIGPVRIMITYADNDPEAVDVMAQMIVDYLNSLPD